jgi:hypothetical protein
MKSKHDRTRLIAMGEELQGEARQLLASSGLLPLLRRYGHVEFVGAYRLGLMVHGDIDAHITKEKAFTKTQVLKILTDIIGKTFFTSYYFGDWDKSGKNPNFPRGYYIGLKKMYCGQKWKIDLWFLSDAEQRRRNKERINMCEVTLTTTQKVTMMRFKQYLHKVGITLWGQKVYEAVLVDGVTTITGFKKWLKR